MLSALFLSCCLLAQEASASQVTDPGVTLRVFQLAGELSELPKLAPDQTPNRDTLESAIDWSGEDFGEFPAPIYAQAFGWLKVTEPGAYRFRLTSDDGSRLRLMGSTVLLNDGVHPEQAALSAPLKLPLGWHDFEVDWFDWGGHRMLRLEWQRPGQSGFEAIPTEHLVTERDLTRVTSPGVKNTIETRKPGVGLPVAGVHPGWRLEDIDTGDVVPQVGAMAFLPDGRLVFSTFNPSQDNTVVREQPETREPDSLYTYDPKTKATQKIATGFFEPTGLCVVDGVLYVAHRFAVVRLADADGDGFFEQHHEIAAGWETWNYHQFVFGLVHREGKLYTNLSTSISPPEWEGLETHSSSNGPLRGGILEIDLGSEEFHVIAAGTRTPNGLGLGPDGGLLYTDNQGCWMPTSLLYEVVPGRFFGHYNWDSFVPVLKDRFPTGGAPSIYGDRPRAQPVLYLPHNEVVNSPTQPLWMETPPLAGELLIAELTAGGIRRASLERVDGVLQGALFRFTQGLESGIHRMALAPDGSIYVGGIGSGGNWNWQGTRFGLQRLVPLLENVFELADMKAMHNGFILRFTRDIDVPLEELPGKITVRSWRYEPTQAYGGPKIDVREHVVEFQRFEPDLEASDTLGLVLDHFEEARCYHVQCDLEDPEGTPLWSGEAWYTLNRIPQGEQPNHTGLGALPPADATPLIASSASTLMQYQGHENERPVLEQSDFIHGPGYVEVGHGSGNLVSTTTHGDAHVHVEWYCPPGGEGDTRSNSGVYLHGRYEVQVFGTPAGVEPRDRGAGSIYGIAAPTLNRSTGPGTWQCYDIFFRAPRFENGQKGKDASLSLYWNGRRVHGNVSIPHGTGSSKDETETPTGRLLLQDYSDGAESPVRFRNVWIRDLQRTEWEAGEWYHLLESPDAWVPRGGQAVYAYADGVLTGETRPNTPNTFYTSRAEYANFELLYEARIDPALNSGVQIRSEVLGGIENRGGALRGYQVEIDPSQRAWTAGLYEERGRGWLHPLNTQPYARRAFRNGEWNRFRVLAEGRRIRTWLNGVPIADVYDAERSTGHLGFQVHGVGSKAEPMTVEWRNVRLRKLTPKPR